MDGAGFDPTRWNHWLLVSCSVGGSIWGLYLSWQWNAEARSKRKRAKLARHLAMMLAGGRFSASAKGRSLEQKRPYEEFTASRPVKK